MSKVNMIVVCNDLDGSPRLFKASILMSSREMESRYHYDKAKEMALEKGYLAPMIVFEQDEFEAFRDSLKECRND